MEIEINISDMGPNGLAHLFLALRDAQEQIEDSKGPASTDVIAYERIMESVIAEGAENSGINAFIALISKLEKA